MTSLTIESPNKSDGVIYQPSSPRIIHGLLQGLAITYQDYSFVDIGCGKGRILLVARRFPFRRVIGVEFARELTAIAGQNLLHYRGQRRCADVTVEHMDATEYQFPLGKLVVFMFNPFSDRVLRRVLDNLNASLAEHPRDVLLVCTGQWMPYQTVESVLMTRAVFHSRRATIYEIGATNFSCA